MKTLHFYLVRQLLATLGITVFVFTLVLLLGNVLKEILSLLIHGQATLGLAFHAIALLIPYVLAFSLPIGMLTAALLVFGRFSADQELTAARASGISLVSLVSPVLVLSIFVSVLCGWLNFEIAPASRVAYKELILHATLDRPSMLLPANQDVAIGDYVIHSSAVHNETNLENVLVYKYNKKGEQEQWIQASSGVITSEGPQKKIVLTLHDSLCMTRDAAGWHPFGSGDFPLPIDWKQAARQVETVAVSDMTFVQLEEELHRVENSGVTNAPAGKTDDAGELERRVEKSASPARVQMNFEVSFSFACIGFTLVGIPLGIRAHRRETSIGIATALVLVLVYYSFIVLATAWASHPERFPQLILWAPNFIFQITGALLLWRANRGV